MSITKIESSCFAISFPLEFMKRMKEIDVKITYASPEERARWAAVAKPIHDKYIAGLEAKGLPARKVYNEANRLLEKYSK